MRQALARALLVLGAVLLSGGQRAGTRPEAVSQRVARPRRTGALVAVFLIFAVLAFSEDVLEAGLARSDFELSRRQFGGLVCAIDLVVLLALAVTGRRARSKRRSGAAIAEREFGASRWWWYMSAGWVLGLDALRLLVLESVPTVPDIALLLAYLPGFVMLFAFVLDVDIVRAWNARPAPSAIQRLDDFVAALPLVVGIGAAFVGQRLYGDTINEIDKEYFSQVTQVIPLLLVALGLERHWFDLGPDTHPVRWGIAVYTVLVLVLGEALAISALPNSKGPLYHWHEYIAFAVSLYACFVALSAVLVVLLSGTPQAGSAGSPPSRAKPQNPPGR